MSEHILVCLADTHLRDSQYGYISRGVDFGASLENIVTNTIRDKNSGKPIAAILHAGDLLDNTRPSPAIVRLLNRLHGYLVSARLAMYVISGNHDKTSPHWTEILETDEDGFGIVCADRRLIPIHMGTAVCNVYGLPFCPKDDMLERLKKEVPKETNVLMWHGAIKEFVKFPMETAVELEEFPKNRFQAIVVGDIHVTDIRLLSDQSTAVISPGSTEMCKSDEPQQKNVVDINFVSEGGKATLHSIHERPIKTRKFLAYRLVNEQDVEDAVAEVRDHLKDNPVIMIRASASLPNVTARFNVVVDRDKCILKIGTLPVTKLDALKMNHNIEKVTPPTWLHKFIPPGTSLYELGQALVNPDINEKDALEKYCAEQLEQIVV